MTIWEKRTIFAGFEDNSLRVLIVVVDAIHRDWYVQVVQKPRVTEPRAPSFPCALAAAAQSSFSLFQPFFPSVMQCTCGVSDGSSFHHPSIPSKRPKNIMTVSILRRRTERKSQT